MFAYKSSLPKKVGTVGMSYPRWRLGGGVQRRKGKELETDILPLGSSRSEKQIGYPYGREVERE